MNRKLGPPWNLEKEQDWSSQLSSSLSSLPLWSPVPLYCLYTYRETTHHPPPSEAVQTTLTHDTTTNSSMVVLPWPIALVHWHMLLSPTILPNNGNSCNQDQVSTCKAYPTIAMFDSIWTHCQALPVPALPPLVLPLPPRLFNSQVWSPLNPMPPNSPSQFGQIIHSNWWVIKDTFWEEKVPTLFPSPLLLPHKMLVGPQLNNKFFFKFEKFILNYTTLSKNLRIVPTKSTKISKSKISWVRWMGNRLSNPMIS